MRRRYWINLDSGEIKRNKPIPDTPHFLTLGKAAAIKCSAAIKAGLMAQALEEANKGIISRTSLGVKEKKITMILKAIGSAIFLTAAVGFLAICFLIDLTRQLYHQIKNAIY